MEQVRLRIANRSYEGGRVYYHLEEPVHRFQDMIIDHILGNKRIPPGDQSIPKNKMLDYSKENFGI